jgi:hypothetical protein
MGATTRVRAGYGAQMADVVKPCERSHEERNRSMEEGRLRYDPSRDGGGRYIHGLGL